MLVIALQSGSTGVERMQWDLWWGEFLRQLGADIACVSKAGIRPWQHDLDCRGMKGADFAAVSHGPTDGEFIRKGVLIAVQGKYVSDWEMIEKDADGNHIPCSQSKTTFA